MTAAITCSILQTTKDAGLGLASVRGAVGPLGPIASLLVAIFPLVLLPGTLVRTVNMIHPARRQELLSRTPELI